MTPFLKSLFRLAAVGGVVFCVASQKAKAATVLWTENFDETLVTNFNGSNIGMTVVANPFGTGSVLEYRDKATTGDWGSEVGAKPTRTFALSATDAVAGTDRVRLTFDYYIPATTAAIGDQMGMMVRYVGNGNAEGGNSLSMTSYLNLSSMVKDAWTTVTLDLAIPATTTNQPIDATSVATTYLAAFIVWRDIGTTNSANLLGYIDNIQLLVTPEPSRALLLSAGLGLMLLKRRRSR